MSTILGYARVSTKEQITALWQLILNSYTWPGNIHELRNIIERAVIISTSENLILPDELQFAREVVQETSTKEIEILPLAQVERQHIKCDLEKTGWQISGAKGAARLLDIPPSTLDSRINKIGLKKELSSLQKNLFILFYLSSSPSFYIKCTNSSCEISRIHDIWQLMKCFIHSR